MLKRWRFWLAAFAVLLAGAFLFYTPSDQITRANCDRIKKGMALQEVEAILACPPGIHTLWPHPGRHQVKTILGNDHPRLISPKTWEGEQGRAVVVFDGDAGTVWKVIYDDWPPEYKGHPRRFLTWVEERLRQR